MYKIGIAMLMVIAISCNNGQYRSADQSDETDEHTLELLQATLFTDKTEFFITHDPLVAGQQALFTIHLTDLETYQPCAPGRFTIELDGVGVTSPESVEPGIFEITLLPERKGEFDITYTYQSGQRNETVYDHADIHDSDDDGQLSGDETEEDHEHMGIAPGEISVPKEQAWKNGLMIEAIHSVPFASVIPTSGEITAVPGRKKNIVAQGPGMVRFAASNLVQGSVVREGEQLFYISNEAVIEDNLLLQQQEARNSYEKSRSEYTRHSALYDEGVISERQYIATRMQYISDSLRYYNLENRMSGNGLKVYATLTGSVHELLVSEGQFVETGQILATISSNQQLLIRADLPQQYFEDLRQVETANFRPAYTERVYGIEEFHGKLLATGSSVVENDHYLPVIFEVSNDGSLLEGAFAEVYLKSSVKKEAIVLPGSAILEEQGNRYAYVQVTGNSFTKRGILTGGNDGKNVEILDGINAGERVVTQGVMFVKAASTSSEIAEHDHNH